MAASRWMTFARIPSPSPMPRVNPDRRTSNAMVQEGSASAPPVRKASTSYASSAWQPLRKFVSPALVRKISPPSPSLSSTPEKKNDCEALSQGALATGSEQKPSKTDTSLQVRERFTRLSQRIRELYDFKTENEWPTRVNVPNTEKQERVWISKSSSEEEKCGNLAGKSTQGVELNNQQAMCEMKNCRCVRKTSGTTGGPASVEEQEESEVFETSQEERWRRFNDRLRYSEDLGQEQRPQLRQRQRRTYSDDYEEKRRRDLGLGCEQRRSLTGSFKSRESRGSYVEIESKRNSRGSEASYVSVESCSSKKKSDGECAGSKVGEDVRIKPLKGFGQNGKSKIGMKRDGSKDASNEDGGNKVDRVNADSFMLERHKRASTRYKVYLT